MHMPVRPSNHAGERLGAKAIGTAGMVASKAGKASSQRAAASAASHAIVAGQAHAGEAALVHGARIPERLLGKRAGFSLPRLFSPQVLARIGRGAMVALPAIGAIFVAHLAHQVS